VILAAIGLVVATAISLRFVRSRPYLFVGWLWFVIMLLPVIGLVKAGSQPISDRYTYLPYLGLSLAVIWALEEFATRSQRHSVAVITGAVAALTMLAIGTLQQLSYWQNSFTIFTRSINMDPKNGIAHCYLGLALNDIGHWEEAEGHFRAALECVPDLGQAHFGLGVVLLKKRQLDDAIVEFEKATASGQDSPEFENNLGSALCMKGRSDEGIAHIRRAIQLRPEYEVAHFNLGQALLKKGQIELAAEAFEQAVAFKPDYLDAHVGLAGIRFSQGRRAEAITHYERAVTLQCNNPFVLNDLAWIRAADPHPEFRNGTQAVMLAERACRLTGYKVPVMIGTLAVAQAEAGRFDEAVASAEKARDLAMKLGRTVLVKKNDELIRLFTDHQRYTESLSPSRAATDKDATSQ
jgi:tetratricopeptide (TPR) repeat protein